MAHLKLVVSTIGVVLAFSPCGLGFSSSSTKLRSTTVPREESASASRYEDLLEWLRSSGSEVSSKIEIKPSPLGGGFGAFVSEPVEAGELLFTVPRQACLTLKDAIEDPVCGEAFGNLIKRAGPGGNTVVMAGFMAREYLLQQEGAGSGSGFGPYFATLPWERGMNNQEHVLFWSKEDVEKYLKGSLCYRESVDLRDEVDLAIKVLNGIIGPAIVASREKDTAEKEEGFSWPWETKVPQITETVDGLPEAVKGAFVSLLTRSFQDDGDDEKLVPMLDMLQHCDEPNVSHAMKKSDGTVEVKAKRDLEAGEELLNQYRSEREENMPYHRFFSRFGFVPGIQESIQSLLEDRSSIFYAQKAEI